MIDPNDTDVFTLPDKSEKWRMLARFVAVIVVLGGMLLLAMVTRAAEPVEIHWACMENDEGDLYLSGIDESGNTYTEQENLGDSVKAFCADNESMQPGDELRFNLRPTGKVL